jgi:hypothetical protein
MERCAANTYQLDPFDPRRFVVQAVRSLSAGVSTHAIDKGVSSGQGGRCGENGSGGSTCNSSQEQFIVRLGCTQKEDENGVPLHRGRQFTLRKFGMDGGLLAQQ